MWVGLPRNISGEKRPGGGMRLSTVQSRKDEDAWKPERIVATRRSSRRTSTSPNLLYIWQNPRVSKKFLRTFHQVTLTFFTLPTKWDVKTWMSQAGNLSAMTLESCAWMTRPSKLPGKAIWVPLKSTGMRVPSQKSTTWKGQPRHPTWWPMPSS